MLTSHGRHYNGERQDLDARQYNATRRNFSTPGAAQFQLTVLLAYYNLIYFNTYKIDFKYPPYALFAEPQLYSHSIINSIEI